MSRFFFISDAHLGLRDDKEERQHISSLLDFFSYVKENGDGLYIVGDLFDFWFEYQSVIPRRHFPIIFALKALVNKGIRVEYITGNHDFGMDSFFDEDLGIPVHHESLDTALDGKRVFIAHGDGLAKKDVGYRLLKKVLRNRINIRLYRLLHPDLGFRLALFCSKLSRNHLAIENREEEYIQYAKTKFADGFERVILAHTHRPQEYRENDFTYINTGDWMSFFSYGKLEEGQLSLEYWKEKIRYRCHKQPCKDLNKNEPLTGDER